MKNTTHHDAKSATALSFFLSNQMVPSRGNGRQPQPKCVACFQLIPSVCFRCCYCRNLPSHTNDVLNANSCASMSSAISVMRQVTVLAYRGTCAIIFNQSFSKKFRVEALSNCSCPAFFWAFFPFAKKLSKDVHFLLILLACGFNNSMSVSHDWDKHLDVSPD